MTASIAITFSVPCEVGGDTTITLIPEHAVELRDMLVSLLASAVEDA